MGILKPKRTMEAMDTNYGICVWRLPDGSYIQNMNGDYLNSFGTVGDKVIEEKMRAAAKSLGVDKGQPWWMPGFRRITQNEWEDQMERMLDGKIPDPADVWRQLDQGGS